MYWLWCCPLACSSVSAAAAAARGGFSGNILPKTCLLPLAGGNILVVVCLLGCSSVSAVQYEEDCQGAEDWHYLK